MLSRWISINLLVQATNLRKEPHTRASSWAFFSFVTTRKIIVLPIVVLSLGIHVATALFSPNQELIKVGCHFKYVYCITRCSHLDEFSWNEPWSFEESEGTYLFDCKGCKEDFWVSLHCICIFLYIRNCLLLL